MVRSGESLRTTTTSVSWVSRAIGVTSARVAGELLVNTLPTTPRPMDITSRSSPLSFTVRPSPTVPPAPGRLNTSIAPVSLASSNALAAVRAVTS